MLARAEGVAAAAAKVEEHMPPVLNPPNAADVRKVVEERLKALDEAKGFQETVAVEWRGSPRPIPVISMPVDLLSYNPDTHRVRAQRSLDPARDKELSSEPFGPSAQSYLHQLLMGNPADPAKTDPAFDGLKEDLRVHGQTDAGIITRSGVLINGNTRRAAMKELGQEHMRVGVLPADASFDDLQSVELALQLRKDLKREYSFMNFLLAIDERVDLGRPATEIQRDFRIKATTYERSRWILQFIREAIDRSRIDIPGKGETAMRLVDFEEHQGKLEELYRAYTSLKSKTPEDAEALREQRLLAIVLGKSKTDVRLIEADFAGRYMKTVLPKDAKPAAAPVKIPGTSISAPAASQRVETLRSVTTEALKARAVQVSGAEVTPEVATKAADALKKLDEALDNGLTQAGKAGRVLKRRLAPSDRLSDVNDALDLCIAAVAEARASSTFQPSDLDDGLGTLRANLVKLAQLASRGDGSEDDGDDSEPLDGVSWLKSLPEDS